MLLFPLLVFNLVLTSSRSNLPPSIWSLIFPACPLVLVSYCLLKPDLALLILPGESVPLAPELASLTFMCRVSTLSFVALLLEKGHAESKVMSV